MKEEEQKTAFLMSWLPLPSRGRGGARASQSLSPGGNDSSLEGSARLSHEESVLGHFLQNQLEVGIVRALERSCTRTRTSSCRCSWRRRRSSTATPLLPARLGGASRLCLLYLVCPLYLVCLVCLLYLVCLVCPLYLVCPEESRSLSHSLDGRQRDRRQDHISERHPRGQCHRKRRRRRPE